MLITSNIKISVNVFVAQRFFFIIQSEKIRHKNNSAKHIPYKNKGTPSSLIVIISLEWESIVHVCWLNDASNAGAIESKYETFLAKQRKGCYFSFSLITDDDSNNVAMDKWFLLRSKSDCIFVLANGWLMNNQMNFAIFYKVRKINWCDVLIFIVLLYVMHEKRSIVIQKA